MIYCRPGSSLSSFMCPGPLEGARRRGDEVKQSGAVSQWEWELISITSLPTLHRGPWLAVRYPFASPWRGKLIWTRSSTSTTTGDADKLSHWNNKKLVLLVVSRTNRERAGLKTEHLNHRIVRDCRGKSPPLCVCEELGWTNFPPTGN